MGIGRMEALEIFTHPDDLEFTIEKEKDGSKYCVLITRGPGHNFKLLISSTFYFEAPEKAVESIKGILESIQQFAIEEFADESSLTSMICNPEKIKVDENSMLSSGLITRIIDELRQHQVASTYKMLAAAG
jgi:hypothetical protein